MSEKELKPISNSIELDEYWNDVIVMLDTEYSHQTRSEGLELLQYKLTPDLLENNESEYIRGVQLAIGATYDKHYTVRAHTSGIFYQVIEDIHSQESDNINELLNDIHRSIDKLSKDRDWRVRMALKNSEWYYNERNKILN
jgi:hypothetical protein